MLLHQQHAARLCRVRSVKADQSHASLQISAVGKTVSLGDHDTEEEAAHAFDRAAINKGGRKAKTNFPMSEYETEMTELTGDTSIQTTVPMTDVHHSHNT